MTISTTAPAVITIPRISRVTASGSRNPAITSTVAAAETPAVPSAFMMTTAHCPLVGLQFSSWVPGPEAVAAQKVCSVAWGGSRRSGGGAVDRCAAVGEPGDLVVGDATQVGVDIGGGSDPDEGLRIAARRGHPQSQVGVEPVDHPGRGLQIGLSGWGFRR